MKREQHGGEEGRMKRVPEFFHLYSCVYVYVQGGGADDRGGPMIHKVHKNQRCKGKLKNLYIKKERKHPLHGEKSLEQAAQSRTTDLHTAQIHPISASKRCPPFQKPGVSLLPPLL